MSLRQIAEARTRTTTSCGCGEGSSTSVMISVRSPGNKTAFIAPHSSLSLRFWTFPIGAVLYRRPRLLHGSQREPFPQMSAKSKRHDHDWQHDGDRRRCEAAPVGTEHARELIHADRGRLHVRAGQGQSKQVLVPGQDHAQDACRGETRRNQWQDYPAKQGELIAPVNDGGLFYVFRDLEYRAAQDPDHYGQVERRVRYHQPWIGVRQVELRCQDENRSDRTQRRE